MLTVLSNKRRHSGHILLTTLSFPPLEWVTTKDTQDPIWDDTRCPDRTSSMFHLPQPPLIGSDTLVGFINSSLCQSRNRESKQPELKSSESRAAWRALADHRRWRFFFFSLSQTKQSNYHTPHWETHTHTHRPLLRISFLHQSTLLPT